MKRRIEQLLNEKFEYQSPTLKSSVEEIKIQARKGEPCVGSFQLYNDKEKRMKGFLYSSDARVAYEPDAFFSTTENIRYEIDINGMEAGEILEGAFTVCANLGEYKIPYVVAIEGDAGEKPKEQTTSLVEFTNLAKTDFQKAYVFFVSQEFYRCLQTWDNSWLSLYEGLRGSALSYRSLEEFLVGTGQKEPVKLQLSKSQGVYRGISQSVKESVTLIKQSWGFQLLNIEVDGAFLQVEKTAVTTDEFVGSNYTLEYVIEAKKLHHGKNYGRLTIRTESEAFVYNILVEKEEAINKNSPEIARNTAIGEMMKSYVDFRLKRIGLNAWILTSREKLNDYRNGGGNHVFFDLYDAQLLFAAEKMVDACLLLESVENQKGRLDSPRLQGYYYYLTTFYNRDTKYVDYVEEQVQGLFLRNKEDWVLQWLLFYLTESVAFGPLDRIGAIREQYICGCKSPIMYLEALQLLIKEPLLLKRLDEFEVQVLRFACKEGVMSKNLAEQAADLAIRNGSYSKSLFTILAECYDRFPTKEMVCAICSILIKAHKGEKEYFQWYAKGVFYELRMTGLYEYYIETMDEDEVKVLPQIIRMYFAYNNTLSYRKKAFVYGNVIRNHGRDPETYRSYRPAMEKFMVDQLAMGRIDRDLALIYDTFLTKAIMNRRMAEGLAKAVFTWELKCDAPEIKSAIVIHNQFNGEQKVAFSDGKAYVQLYTDNYQILLEDSVGERFSSSISYKKERLLGRPIFMEYCKELAWNNPGLILNSALDGTTKVCVKRENVDGFTRLLDMDGVRERFKEELREKIMEFYYQNPQEESLYEYLHKINLEKFAKTDKKKLIELLTAEGMCKEAYTLVSTYGPERIDTIALVRLCSRVILDREYGKDDMLLFLCAYCFSKKKYDETVLSYLLLYYDGPIDFMKEIWKAGKEFELDTFELEEKILLMTLFMDAGRKGTEEIFESYRKKLGKKRLCLAYIIMSSYDYFVREKEVGKPVFEYMEYYLGQSKYPEVTCMLAMLRYFSRQKEYTERQEELICRLLEDVTYRGLRFAFFEELPEQFTRPCQIWDKTYLEYRTGPEARVLLYYKNKGQENYSCEPMKHMYEGIFIKELTMFLGDELVYYTVVESDGQTKTEEVAHLSSKKQVKEEGTSRYDLINRMAYACDKGNEENAKECLQTYLEQEFLMEELFDII